MPVGSSRSISDTLPGVSDPLSNRLFLYDDDDDDDDDEYSARWR
jgi:hypothetical protein